MENKNTPIAIIIAKTTKQLSRLKEGRHACVNVRQKGLIVSDYKTATKVDAFIQLDPNPKKTHG